MENRKLYLIDGHALVFKMYYALLRRPMVNSKGVDTSILYGFTKYLFELIEKEKPTHLAVMFDPPGGSFRNVMYPEYKANRDATPQLIIDALEPLTDICQSLRIPVIMMMGYEADDVVGSMAKRAETEGFKVYMVTPDKDYGQLISENIWQYKPGKSGNEAEIYGIREVCERYGIQHPEQVIDMLAICGDASDNVPGVKGVGEKGASKLIGTYGSLEAIYENLDKLSEKQRAMFEQARGHIALSKELVTIKTDIQIDVPTSAMEMDGVITPRAAELFDYYEFSSLKRYLKNLKVDGTLHRDSPIAQEDNKRFSHEVSAPEEVCAEAKKHSCCGVRTYPDGKIAIAAGKDRILSAEAGSEAFEEILCDGNIAKYCYDIKPCLKTVDLAGPLMDVALMDYVLSPEKSHKLESLAKTMLGVDLDDGEQTSETPLSLFDEETEEKSRDTALEAAAVLKLGMKLEQDLADSGLKEVYMNIEEPLIRVLSRMERWGVKMDLGSLREFADQLRKEVAQRQETIRSMVGKPMLNISSPKQIAELIYDDLQLLPRKKKGNDSTDEETLLGIADKHPVVSEILEFRAAKKLLSTYIEPFPGYISPADGKVHTTFNQGLTATGRLSSSNPNLQNIPIRTERGKEIRKAFVPSTSDGLILSADYSQIELRIMAHLSQDTHLIEAFNSGMDVHKATAAKIYGVEPSEVTADQRRKAKTVNFGIMYGMSAFGLSQRLGCDRNEAKKIIDDYFASFPAIRSFIQDTLVGARENGYVETLFGRRRYVPDVNSSNGTVRAVAERNAVNAPIQGTSADIIKIAMANVDRRLAAEGMKSRMVLQIHDELVFDTIPQEVEALRNLVMEEMEHVMDISVPLTVECNYGKNWLEAH